MYCKKCGKDYPKNKKTCKDCGIALTPGKSPGSKKNSNIRLFIVGGSILVVIIALFLIIGLGGMLPEQLKGKWYDKAGVAGTIEFEPSSHVQWTASGVVNSGNYSYSSGTGKGSVKLSNADNTHEFTCDGTTLTMDGITYTKEYASQSTASSQG